MFCKCCGSEIKSGDMFCKECGAKIEGTVEVSSVQGQSGAEGSKKVGFGIVLIGKLLILIALICFFFTFMSVSCSGEKEEISGKDMIFGNSSITDSVDEQSDSHSSLFNIFVCLSAVSGIAAIVINRRKISAGLSGLSAFLLLIFRFSAKYYYKIGDQSLKEFEEETNNLSNSINQIGEEYMSNWGGSEFEVKFGFALYLAIILFLAAAVVIGIAAANKNQPAVLPAANDTNVHPLSQDNQDNTANIGVQSEKSENQQ